MRLWKTLFLIAAVSLAGCAHQQEVSYQDVYKQKQDLLRQVPDPVTYQPRDTHPKCDGKTCTFSVHDANVLLEDSDRQQEIIRQLNKEVRSTTEAYNAMVRALIECEYGSAQRDATIHYQEQQSFRDQIISTGKQIVLGGVCGLLLLH